MTGIDMETVQHLINTIINSIDEGIELAPAYVQDLVSRYSMYGIFISSIYLLLSIGTIILCIIFAIKTYKSNLQDYECIIPYTLIIVFGGIAIGLCMSSIQDLMEFIFIPEIALIHFIS